MTRTFGGQTGVQALAGRDVDAMTRWMPQYFRPYEARGLAFTARFDLTGDGGGRWAMHVADGRCEVRHA